MIYLLAFLLTVLLICDIVLVMYCKVKNGFRMFAFRCFAVLLVVMTLMLTGDITIAYGG